MKYALFIVGLLFIAACKKDSNSTPDAPYIDFTTSGGLGALPQTVTFTATAPNTDEVTWDFGDSTFATGITVSHTYTRYDCFRVKATTTVGSQEGNITKDVPVTLYRKINFTSVTITQIPPFGPNGNDWDPDGPPDLKIKVKIGNDSIVDPGTILGNSTSGTIYLPATYVVKDFTTPITIEVYDKDATSSPDLYLMGSVTFKFCQFITATIPYPNDGQVNNGLLRVTVGFSWVL